MAELSDQLAQFQGPLYTPHDDPGRPLQRPEPRFGSEELAGGYAAPGRDADVEVGLLYRGDHETLDDGMCRQVRLAARALADTGVPVALRSLSNRVRHGDEWFLSGEDMIVPEVIAEIGPLRRRTIARAGIQLVHTVVWDAMGLWRAALPIHVQREGEEYVESLLRRTILFLPWERSVCSDEMAAAMNRLGQVWVACQINVDAFVSSGVDRARLRIVPGGYDPNGPVCQIPRQRPQPPKGKRFYNIGKWEPRKGHQSLIGAFLFAHRPTDEATLTLKTHGFGMWDDYPKDAVESIRLWLDNATVRSQGWRGDNINSRVRVETRVFSDEQIAKLHEVNNIYVAAGHAEAWDYPAFDALCAGNALVHIGYSASADYAPAEAIRVPWEFGPVHAGYHWEEHARWAHYSVVALEEALRKAQPPDVRVPRGRLERSNVASIGATMRANVDELARERGVALTGTS